ncbi:mitochondrial thiamine pyrophosphate carrier [Aedes aegypti]|uniref:Mitochondrial thiamine pyrophosphate carrier n=1 Tax=Aedes aegypti TaxID=7159 RepID=A0A0P6IUA4_AEDAE|nr:mitochondrial thiamine pyrophosphate carrier [Aedes aegypti]XP_021697638.1 mitochondrial thiamine pyrophosphate carrier [Aedes aegypti]XP_021697639.1 mitochondrial thiamine pyrophosphate carrier [Aedes aegypti]XP_021697640.1 mitochondrial thiamine pyrophosphate carrier [Aedes aegypti]XP_021697641.1 mitochondrial thiamine pyrophosphate carrier [Aedes aegypti]XP_021697642.1 mitochondrial thiamine pyrophosphate carrier [Aedes aegypti]
MDRDKNDTSSNTGLAGGFAGCITRFICQPLDVLKIRFQLQVEPLSEDHMTSKYRTIVQSTRLVYKEEGLRAFWKGHNPAQVLSIIYGVSQFSSYEHTNFFLRQFEPFERHQNARNFFCGALSGTVATVITLPLDVVRTRLISQDPNRGYKNSMQGLKMIYRHEGIRGMYRGLSPSVLQIAPLTGGQFMFYNIFGSMFRQYFNIASTETLPAVELFICGGLAGICTKLLVYPLDLAKKRLQIQGFAKSRQTFGRHFVCDNMFNCMYNIVKQEGFWGLYKGLYPALLKACFMSAFYFAIYDEMVWILNH